jgi:predicted hydrolase (HD superfamily)
MDSKLFGIGILSLMAVVLVVANFMPVDRAEAATVIKDRDYQLVTARNTQGGEALYVIDNRTGLIAAFTWDATTKTVKPRDVQPVMNLFNQR